MENNKKIKHKTHRNKYTTEDFIKKAKEIHGNKYDYSKVKYDGASTKVCIICPEHGKFWQRPSDHLRGCNCPKCAKRKDLDKTKTRLLTTEQFIEKAKKIYGDKYDYSKVNYINSYTKVCIVCPKHGEFWQTPNNHLRGEECPKENNKSKKKLPLKKEEFIQRAKNIHGDKYDYSKVEYINMSTKVCIVCPKHGEFWQTPSNHIFAKHQCPICARKKE